MGIEQIFRNRNEIYVKAVNTIGKLVATEQQNRAAFAVESEEDSELLVSTLNTKLLQVLVA